MDVITHCFSVQTPKVCSPSFDAAAFVQQTGNAKRSKSTCEGFSASLPDRNRHSDLGGVGDLSGFDVPHGSGSVVFRVLIDPLFLDRRTESNPVRNAWEGTTRT